MVSIIIPTYNRAHIVTRAIDSALNQSYKDIEIIVVDDGSTDHTEEIIRTNYKQVVKYILQPNKGAPAARNLGFNISQGQYVNFLDSDDYFLPENIKLKVEAFEADHSLGWVFSDSYYVENTEDIKYIRNPVIKNNISSLISENYFFNLMLLNMGKLAHTNTVLLRRNCVKEIGGWDTSLSALQDNDFFIRISKGYHGRFIDKALVIIEKTKGSVSSDLSKKYAAEIKLINKINTMYWKEIKIYGLTGAWKMISANALNQYAYMLLMKNKFNDAIKYLINSIKCRPLQRVAYILLLRSIVLRSIKG